MRPSSLPGSIPSAWRWPSRYGEGTTAGAVNPMAGEGMGRLLTAAMLLGLGGAAGWLVANRTYTEIRLAAPGPTLSPAGEEPANRTVRTFARDLSDLRTLPSSESGKAAPEAAKAPAAADSRIVVSPKAALRSTPAPSGAILRTYPTGAKVTVTGSRGEWLKVTVEDGRSGWMWSTSLVKADRVKATEAAFAPAAAQAAAGNRPAASAGQPAAKASAAGKKPARHPGRQPG